MLRRKSSLDDENDEMCRLIWSVRQRPMLYNYKLPAQERRRVDISKGWQEVADEIGAGRFTAEDCRRKWKNLRDTYHQYRLRKSKYKDCLGKWRYTKDMAFLESIYRPKLKSERKKYLKEQSSSNGVYSIGSLIEVDEDSSSISFNIGKKDDTMTEPDYDGSIEHVDMEEVQFSGVETVGEINTADMNDGTEAYAEVCLYEEGEANVEETNLAEEKFNVSDQHDVKFVEIGAENSERIHLTVGSGKDELDFFFQFLKTKIQKLPAVDITAIQIEFLNVVLKKEAALGRNSRNSMKKSWW